MSPVVMPQCDRTSLCVHGQNLFLDVLTDAGLALFQHLGLEFALAITGHGNIHFPEAGAQRLATMAISAVVRVLAAVVIFAVAQFIVQLRVKAVFHELGNGFLEQILNVGHTAYIAHLQQFPDFCPSLHFFRSTFLSYHNINLHCDASILHHNGGLHKIGDGLAGTLTHLIQMNSINDTRRPLWAACVI